MIEILPVTGIGEVKPGDGLGHIIADRLATMEIDLRPDDIIVVTQKVVSKAEGRFVDLASVTPGQRARELAETTRKDARLVELVLAESSDVIRAVPGVLLTRHRLGLVMANAGIDRSNIGPDDGGERVLLLPVDPDGSADALADALAARCGVRPAIVISDSFGRPWRHGVVCVAIGVAGLPALLDRRGDLDRDGRRLEVTQIAVGDMVATAAGMATGEGAEGIPVVVVRGFHVAGAARPAADLVRPLVEDLFR